MSKPPPGYVLLEDVVDLVGGVVAGANWRQLPDKTRAEERFNAVWSDPDVDSVITMIAEACEDGRLEAAYQTAFGADGLDRKMWRMPNWRNYFAAGTIDLDLPYLDNQQPILDGRTVRCPERELYIRKDSLERFMEPLAAVTDPGGVHLAAAIPSGVQTNKQAALKGRCSAWIRTLPTRPPRRKSDVKVDAVAAIPGLSGRQFDAAWDEAAPPEWKRAGRRSEN
jgi:hypothetical protein